MQGKSNRQAARCALAASLAGLTAAMIASGASAQAAKPNFVVILVDDAALMDFGVTGGEARTPNIDALAARGALFTQYRTSPLCSPSRAMLLTGIDNHRTGVATIPEVLPPEHEGKPGYSLALEPGVETLADRLKPAGYRTLMSGKWHMGSRKGDLPNAHGFDRSFALDASGADNWEDKSYMPFYTEAPWYEDGEPASLPEDFYSSRFIVDKAISYIDETAATGQPFFAYVAFQAIHIPVQAPPEFTAHYSGIYDDGWQVLREARHQRAMTLGLIPEGAPLAAMQPHMRDWDSLPEDDKRLYAARMEVEAGMLEAMDEQVGRLVDHLKATGDYDNTVFFITSDNGPEPSRGDDDARLSFWMRLHGYHTGIKRIGEKGSWGFIGPEWASAAASPSDLFKFYASEGGVRVPLIVAGPGIQTEWLDSAALVTDITPTALAMAGVDPDVPSAVALTGRNLLPVLTGAATETYGAEDSYGIEVSGNSAFYKGQYKIVRNVLPVGDGQWRLFDLEADPGETKDLATALPDVMLSMQAGYTAYTEQMGVLEMPPGYDSSAQIETNTLKRQWEVYRWPTFGVAGVMLVGLARLALFLRRMRRRRR